MKVKSMIRFLPDLMKKFKELSELIQDVFPNEMLNSMEKAFQQALEEMDSGNNSKHLKRSCRKY